jgi:hypothetical protein
MEWIAETATWMNTFKRDKKSMQWEILLNNVEVEAQKWSEDKK